MLQTVGMQTIHILVDRYCIQYRLLTVFLRQGKLHNIPVAGTIVIELANSLQHFAHVFVAKAYESGLDAYLAGSLQLLSHV